MRGLRGRAAAKFIGAVCVGTLFALGMLPARLAVAQVAHLNLAPPPAQKIATPSLPVVLSLADVERYRRIFDLQKDARWPEADRLIADLSDKLLLGHVLAQRYLHASYRTRFDEAASWLAIYADHPDARVIHELALRRRPAKAAQPKAPAYVVPGNPPGPTYVGDTIPSGEPRPGLSANDQRTAEKAIERLRAALRKGATQAAKVILEDDGIAALLSPLAVDAARTRLAAGYFAEGHDAWALKWANLAMRSAKQVPEVHWTAGLAAWRLGKYAEAGKHFETLALRSDISPWLISGAAFWAARAHLKDRRPAAVGDWLQKAAAHPRTFYGILASRLLGLPLGVRWAEPGTVRDSIQAIAATPAGRRGLALLQFDQDERAAGEFLGLASSPQEVLRFGVMTIAGQAGLPLLAVRLDGAFNAAGQGFDGAAYPVPSWSPEGGFRVDRALIYALIHQESRFNPRAKSPAGAAGLMQLMPATASLMARGNLRRGDLFDPAVNIELGQRYIETLLADQDVGGDLLRMAVAWNSGPGNLAKWLKTANHSDDPLLFIESITRRETREFAEKLMTNYWIYRDRLGQTTASLDAIAAGQWPAYIKQDEQPETEVADDGRSKR